MLKQYAAVVLQYVMLVLPHWFSGLAQDTVAPVAFLHTPPVQDPPAGTQTPPGLLPQNSVPTGHCGPVVSCAATSQLCDATSRESSRAVACRRSVQLIILFLKMPIVVASCLGAVAKPTTVTS